MAHLRVTPAFMFSTSFSHFSFLFVLRKCVSLFFLYFFPHLRWREHDSTPPIICIRVQTKDVSSVVGVRWRCGVLAT